MGMFDYAPRRRFPAFDEAAFELIHWLRPPLAAGTDEADAAPALSLC
jgi:hypothetical protein